MEETEKMNYIKKLLKGEVPLFISFWIWFILVSFVIEFFFESDLIQNNYYLNNKVELFDLILYSLTLIYSILIFLIIYKSANKYLGNKIWSFLAKVIVTINLFFSLTVLNETIKFYFWDDYSIEKDIEEFKENLPIIIDSKIQLVDIGKKEKTIFYVYKFSKLTFNKHFKLEKFKKQVQSSLCEEGNSLDLLKKDYVLDYKYLDENESEIIDIYTDKTACGKDIYDLDILKSILKAQGEI